MTAASAKAVRILLAILAQFSVAAALSAQTPLAFPLVSYPFVDSHRCNFNRIMIGPSGTELAMWEGDGDYLLGSRIFAPSLVVLGRMSGSGEGEFYGYSGGGEMFFPVRWSRDGARLYARTRGGAELILALDPDGAGGRVMAALDRAWHDVDLTAVRHGDVGDLTRPDIVARARRLQSEGVIRASATMTDSLVLVGALRSNLDLVRVADTSLVPIGINAGQTRQLVIHGDARSFDLGISFLGAGTDGGRGPFIPYQLPLTDLSTGAVIGGYGATQVALRAAGSSARSLARFNQVIRERGLVIVDASATGDVIAVLTLSRLGERSVFRLDSQSHAERPLCVTRGTDATAGRGTMPTLSSFAIGDDGRILAEDGHPLLMVHGTRGVPATDAVVYFHGGPGGTLAEDYFPEAVERLLRPGRDVIAVEYSGSQGGGIALTRRLPERGMAAIEEDVSALVRWLRTSRYRNVYVVGASFGAVPALVAVTRHPRVFRRGFFIAPYLRMRDPEQWTGAPPRAFGRVGPGTQLAYEHAYFGGAEGRRRFGAALGSMLSAARLRRGDVFYFGALDRVSQSADLPADSLARRRVFPRMQHLLMLANDELWRDIDSSIAPAMASN